MKENETHPSPGHDFVNAFIKDGEKTKVSYDYSITETIVGTRRKVRHPARNIFKVININENMRTFWLETPVDQAAANTVNDSNLRPEAARVFQAIPIPELLPTTAWVQLPPGMGDDPDAMAAFIDYRLVIRLCTAENEALTRGPSGLLNTPGIDWVRHKSGFTSPLYAACDEIEQMGCTADGLIMNPVDYWLLSGNTNVIGVLEDNGLAIVRTRMIEPGHAIVGDFMHGCRLLDRGRSSIEVCEPPPGTFAQPGLALKAQIHERLVVNLPMNFYHVSLKP